MKTIVILWMALILSTPINANPTETDPPQGGTGTQTTATTTTGNQATTGSEDLKAMKEMIEKVQSDLKKAGITPDETKKEPADKVLSRPQKVLITLPVILFFLCLIITFLFPKNGFDFRKSFYSEEPQQKTIQTDPVNNPKDTVTITLLEKDTGMPIYKLSVSRIIAFISSLTTLSVIVCFISYYAYCMLREQVLPDFKNLFEVIVGLGLGILPYGFSKLTSTAKSTGT